MAHGHELMRQPADEMEITVCLFTGIIGTQSTLLQLLDGFLPLLISFLYHHQPGQFDNGGIFGRVILGIYPPVIITNAHYCQPTDNGILIFVVLQWVVQQCNAQPQYLSLDPAHEFNLFIGFFVLNGLVLLPLLEFLYNGSHCLDPNLLPACQLVCWSLLNILILCSQYITQHLLPYSGITLNGGDIHPTVQWPLGLDICFFAVGLK